MSTHFLHKSVSGTILGQPEVMRRVETLSIVYGLLDLMNYFEQNKVVEGSIWITDGNRTAKIDSHEKLENFDIETFFKK